MKKACLIAILLLIGLMACQKQSPKPRVYFANLVNGAEVHSPFLVQMRAENLIVEPATSGINQGHGHFHIIINNPLPPETSPIPMDSQHIHYGKGQVEDTLDLPVGDHTLTLQFAKGDHIPYKPQIYQQVRIRVLGPAQPPSP